MPTSPWHSLCYHEVIGKCVGTLPAIKAIPRFVQPSFNGKMFFKTRMAEMLFSLPKKDKMSHYFGLIVTEDGSSEAKLDFFPKNSEVRHLGNNVYGYQHKNNWVIRIPSESPDYVGYLTGVCWLINIHKEEVARTFVNGETVFDFRKL